MSTTETTPKGKKKAIASTHKADPKFRVIPNLSLRGKDIRSRYLNRTLVLGHESNYSLDEQIDATRRMSKTDLMHTVKENLNKIESLKSKLQSK